MKLLCQGGNPLYTRTYRHCRESREGRETPGKKKQPKKKPQKNPKQKTQQLISGKKKKKKTSQKRKENPLLSSEKKPEQNKILLFLKNEICSNNIPTHSFMAASQLIN